MNRTLLSICVLLSATLSLDAQKGDGKAPPADATSSAAKGQGGRPVPSSLTTKSKKDRPIPPGCWFKKIHLDFGNAVEKPVNLVEGTYEFMNPTDKVYKITNLIASCKCQELKIFVDGEEKVLERTFNRSLKNPLVVPPGVKGKIVMKLDISGTARTVTGDIRFETTDPQMSSFVLTAQAVVTAAYEITPSVINLGNMTRLEQKKWSFTARCNTRKEWKITRVDPVKPKGLEIVAMERKTDERGLYYEVRGVYGPGIDDGSYGGYVLFHTDKKDESFQVQVLSQVKSRVTAQKVFWSFRSYPRSQALSHTLHYWPVDFTEDITIERVEIYKVAGAPLDMVETEIVPPVKAKPGQPVEKLQFGVVGQNIPADKIWKVVVKVKPNIPGRVLRIKGKVHFKHVGVSPKTFQCNGFPRPSRR